MSDNIIELLRSNTFVYAVNRHVVFSVEEEILFGQVD
jgi:hypothetical protein